MPAMEITVTSVEELPDAILRRADQKLLGFNFLPMLSLNFPEVINTRNITNSWTCIYLEPVCPLFWGFNPPKEGLFQSKQGSFGFQVYIYYILYIYDFDFRRLFSKRIVVE